MNDNTVKDILLQELGEVLTAQSIFTDLFFIMLIFLASLGMVYLLGRVLGLVNSMRGRNLVGLITMSTFSFFYVFIIDHIIPAWITNSDFLLSIYKIFPDIGKLVIFILLEILLYTLIGMKLYSRIDNLLDGVSKDSDYLKDESDIFAKDFRKKTKKK